MTVKSVVNPISYLMEQQDPNVPKRFAVKSGVYRIDSNGRALFRDIVSEKARFSSLEAYDFKVNRLSADKLVMTSVASNVVDTDTLLKSRGIAEFDGVVNSSADMFLEKGSLNVGDGVGVTFRKGAALTLENGAKFEMGTNTTVKMSGDIELDLSKLVFSDSKTGRKFRISFRDAHGDEGSGVIMEYNEVSSDDVSSIVELSENAALDASELSEKLEQLGV